ncbi:unnamed protein product [Mycena citricolor]|uniref:Uncharacterized protein n=1 Tax=Mycena citricolor TaxID=2018698 RepID=A0AAD2JXX5_9AGAR|nr:unnamed protein product [Mycena citricolor]CAK5268032.1 unnamed protein product [Mycena citricolor]
MRMHGDIEMTYKWDEILTPKHDGPFHPGAPDPISPARWSSFPGSPRHLVCVGKFSISSTPGAYPGCISYSSCVFSGGALAVLVPLAAAAARSLALLRLFKIFFRLLTARFISRSSP